MFFQQEILTHFIQEHRSYRHIKRNIFPRCLITKKRKQINSFISWAKNCYIFLVQKFQFLGADDPNQLGGRKLRFFLVVPDMIDITYIC